MEDKQTLYPGLSISANESAQLADSKVLRLMALNVDDIMPTVFESVDRGAGVDDPPLCLKPQLYFKFWLRSELNATFATEFMAKLIGKLQDILDKDSATKEVVIPICNTLMMATLFLDHKEKIVHAALVKLQKAIPLTKLDRFPSATQVIQAMLLTRTPKISDAIGWCVIRACVLNRVEGPLNAYPCESNEIKGSHDAFNFLFLRNCAYGSDEQHANVLEHCMNKLLTVCQQMKVSAIVAQSTLMALIHMIQRFLCVAPMKVASLPMQMKGILGQFLMWPRPYCDIVKHLLSQIEMEVRVPGTMMLKYQMGEATVSHGRSTKQGVRSQALFWITNTTCEGSKARLNAMRIGTSKGSLLDPNQIQRRPSMLLTSKTQRVSALNAASKLMLMMEMIHHCEPFTEEETGTMSSISEDAVHTCFQSVEDLLEQMEASADPMKAKEMRESHHNSLKSSLLEAATKEGSPIAGVVFKPPFRCPLPDIFHFSAPSTLRYDLSDKESLRLALWSYIPFPETAVMEQLEQILSMEATTPKPLEIRIAIAGDEPLLHSFLCSYLYILQAKPDWLLGITLKFYVVPFEYSTVAGYIARHDGWYARHVFYPALTANVIVPNTTPEEIKAEDKASCPIPGRVLRDLFESYVRDARHQLNIIVYQVEGWLDKVEQPNKEDKMAHLPDHRIPFLSRVQVTQGKPKGRRGEEEGIKEQEMNVRCTTMDFIGKEHDEAESVGNFSAINISNIPSPDDTSPANPQHAWLEVHAIMQRGSGGMFSGNIFSKNPRQHVSKIEVQTKNVPFNCVIDGKSFGPYIQIKVTKVEQPLQVQQEGQSQDAGSPFLFPIQTFTPICAPLS